MRWLSRTVTIALVVALTAIVAVVVYTRVAQQKAGGGFRTSALFRDASKLPIGSRVMIAGVHVGEIDALTVEGRLARVSMRLRDDVEIYDDAWAEKRAESLFGDGYIEIHPGGGPGARRLASGEPIPRVEEGASTDRTLRAIDQGLPNVESFVDDTGELFLSARETINGPWTDRVGDADRALRDSDLAAPLHELQGDVDDVHLAVVEAAQATDGLAPRVNRALDDFHRDVTDFRADLREGQRDLQESLATARTRIDEVDPYVEDAAEIVRRLSGRTAEGGEVPVEEQGTLARLVNDPELGDDLADATEGVRAFTAGLDRLDTIVGLRYEYGFRNSDSRLYVGAEIYGRPDSFVLLEAVKTQTGDVPEVTLEDVPEDDRFVRTAVIRDELKLSVQWGRVFGPVRARMGLRESAFGVGADAILLGGQLQFSADLFGPNFVRAPNLKVAAAMRVFESIYIVAGGDDILTAPGEFPIVAGADDVPQQLRELKYGRDFFGGVFFRFDDEDLNRLLLLYGAVVFAAL